MKIGFIGVGKLGKEAAEVVANHHDVVGFDVVDVKPSNFTMVNSIKQVCQDREIIFVNLNVLFLGSTMPPTVISDVDPIYLILVRLEVLLDGISRTIRNHGFTGISAGHQGNGSLHQR